MVIDPSVSAHTMHRERYFFLLVTCLSWVCGVTSGLMGRRCCEKNTQVLLGGDCVPSNNDISFSPHFNANRSQPPEILSWKFDPLQCPPGYEVKKLPLDGANNSLEIKMDGIYLKRDVSLNSTSEFCVGLDGEGKNQYIAAVCLPYNEKICKNQTCLQRCFAQSQNNHLKKNNSLLEFHDLNGNKVETPLDIYEIEAFPKCDSPTKLSSSFYVLRNGMLYSELTGRQYQVGEYCLVYGVEKKNNFAYVCNGFWVKIKTILIKVGLVISCAFLSLTILLHLAIPQFNELQNRCLLCHMISLLILYTVLFINSHFRSYINTGHCVANGMILHYAFLSTFFWLNVMCFDVWRFIKATVKMTPLPWILADDRSRFRLYSVYAWGVPLVIVIVTAIIHFLGDEHFHEDFIRPEYEKICWITGDRARYYYQYIIITSLLVLNFVLLVHVMVMLFQADSMSSWEGCCCCCSREILLTAFNRKDLDVFRQRFSLFCLMVLFWVAEILSLSIHPKEIWITTDFINSLQGFLIFIIFISSRKRRTVIREHWQPSVSKVEETPSSIIKRKDSAL